MIQGFCILHEAAKKLGCDIKDLLQLGINGEIDLYIRYQGQYHSPYDGELHIIKEFVAISDEDILRVLLEHIKSPRLYAIREGCETIVALKHFEQSAGTIPKTVTLETFPNADSLFLNQETFDNLKDKFTHGKKSISLKEDEKSKTSNLHIIGALLEIVMDGDKFKSETELRQHIADKYKGFMGCSEKTLANRFKEAKNLLLN